MLTIALSLLLTVGLASATANGVQIKFAESQKTTSSTLQWIQSASAGMVPKDAVVGSVRYLPPAGNEDADISQLNITSQSQLRSTKIYICRSFQNGNWIPGALYEQSDTCVAALFSHVMKSKLFDVLVNVDGGARLVWTRWEMSVEVPKGAVAAGEYFIAHTPSPAFKVLTEEVGVGTMYRIGKIDPYEGIFGRMSVIDEDNNVISQVDSGEVLVEIEPVLYELTVTSVQTSRSKVRVQKSIRLGEVTLRNDDDQQMKAESVITYTWKYESNWGHGKAMIKALKTSIQFHNSTPIETISWGLPLQEVKNGIENVQSILDANTARHVTVNAIFEEVEVPYSGELLSVFLDNQTMNRNIHETRKYSRLSNVTIHYGPAYFTQNNSLVPTTTTTTAETPSTSNTWTTPTTTPTIAEINIEDKLNTILPPKEVNNNDLIDENSDALQLKNKDTQGNSAKRYLAKWSILITIVVVGGFIYV